MPAEFLTDEQAARYRRYAEPPSHAHLDPFFHLDGADWELIASKRRGVNRLGFAVQLCTARAWGIFTIDLGEIPNNAVVYLAEQLEIADFVPASSRWTDPPTPPPFATCAWMMWIPATAAW
ncbi:hypothetical protein GCM10027294_22240 [Marinactinospora endophytica]